MSATPIKTPARRETLGDAAQRRSKASRANPHRAVRGTARRDPEVVRSSGRIGQPTRYRAGKEDREVSDSRRDPTPVMRARRLECRASREARPPASAGGYRYGRPRRHVLRWQLPARRQYLSARRPSLPRTLPARRWPQLHHAKRRHILRRGQLHLAEIPQTTWPSTQTSSSVSAAPIPKAKPPSNCPRWATGSMIVPTSATSTALRTLTTPVSRSTHLDDVAREVEVARIVVAVGGSLVHHRQVMAVGEGERQRLPERQPPAFVTHERTRPERDALAYPGSIRSSSASISCAAPAPLRDWPDACHGCRRPPCRTAHHLWSRARLRWCPRRRQVTRQEPADHGCQAAALIRGAGADPDAALGRAVDLEARLPAADVTDGQRHAQSHTVRPRLAPARFAFERLEDVHRPRLTDVLAIDGRVCFAQSVERRNSRGSRPSARAISSRCDSPAKGPAPPRGSNMAGRSVVGVNGRYVHPYVGNCVGRERIACAGRVRWGSGLAPA